MDAISLRSATESSDEALIISSRAGDRDSVDLLYRRHHDAAFRFACRLMGNATDADDIAHEAFIKVMAAINRGNGPDAVFRPYLFRAVRTVAADHWEQQAKETPSEETPDTAVQDLGLEAVLNQDSITPVYKAFESLPARWRTVLWHAEVENEPPRRIAPLLGIEPNAVSALLMRARRGLREAYLHQYAAAELPQAGCRPTLPFLAGTVLGTASAQDRNAAKEHARTCEDCRKVLADLGDIKKTMRVLVAPVLLLSPSFASASGLSLPRWNPVPRLTTGFLAASVIAAIAAAVGLVLVVQTAGTPTQHTLAAHESATTSLQTPAGAPGTPSSSAPSQSAIESSPAGAPATTDLGGTEPLTVPFLPRRPANPPRPPLAPPGNSPKLLASNPVAPKPSPSATTTPSPSPSPSKSAPSHTAIPTPAPVTATPTATPSTSASSAAPSTTPAPPLSAPPACVPFFTWCLPV